MACDSNKIHKTLIKGINIETKFQYESIYS